MRRTPVSESGLIQRINRKLSKEQQCLKKTRGQRALLDLGDFYILDWQGNFIREHHVDVELLGRELEVLKKWEVLKGGE
jgi:hypothetical protein